MEDILIPIVLFTLVFSIPIIAVISDGRSKRSRDRVMEKAIESGMALGDVQKLFPAEAERTSKRRAPYRKGLTLLAVGGALLVARMVSDGENGITINGDIQENMGGIMIGGIICLFLGIAMLTADFLNRGERTRDD